MKMISELWHSENADDWQCAIDKYWDFVQTKNIKLEQSMQTPQAEKVKAFSADQWFRFLQDEYFVWKYTDSRWFAPNLGRLQSYQKDNMLGELDKLRMRLIILVEENEHVAALKQACEIRGLGIAGASGLLAVMYPHIYGTVDQFVAVALADVKGLPEAPTLKKIRPQSLTIKNGILLIDIMRRQAIALNRALKTDSWTPRKIDMVLWASRQRK